MVEQSQTEDEMRSAWVNYAFGLGESPEQARAEFDRFLARVRRDAAREALDGLAADRAPVTALLRAENGGNVEDVITHYRDTHHPEEETR